MTLARGCNTYSVAEHAITLMLAALRQISQLDREVRKGDWKSRDRVETHEARGKVFGSYWHWAHWYGGRQDCSFWVSDEDPCL